TTTEHHARGPFTADDDLAFAGLARLSELLSRGQVTPRELTEFYLARIERIDPTLGAFISVRAERALAEADAALERLRAGERRSRADQTAGARSGSPRHSVDYSGSSPSAAGSRSRRCGTTGTDAPCSGGSGGASSMSRSSTTRSAGRSRARSTRPLSRRARLR